MIIGLIRHGKTDWNAQGRIQGQTDIPLNAEGIAQAQALAARLAADDRSWDAVITSDLARARETGRWIAEALDIPILEPDARLRERSFGEIEGTTEAERIARWGQDWRRADAGQETDDEVRERAVAFIEERRARQPDARLLIVSHGSLLAVLLRSLCEQLEDGYLVNMSYSILQYEPPGWRTLLHNCTRHLEALECQS